MVSSTLTKLQTKQTLKSKREMNQNAVNNDLQKKAKHSLGTFPISCARACIGTDIHQKIGKTLTCTEEKMVRK